MLSSSTPAAEASSPTTSSDGVVVTADAPAPTSTTSRRSGVNLTSWRLPRPALPADVGTVEPAP